jgi:hypothetical protein
MLERFQSTFKDKGLGLVLIASPSLGSVYANRLDTLARFYNQQLGLQLKWGGEDLADLDDRFKDLVFTKALPRLTGVEAYEHYFILRKQWLPKWFEPWLPNRRKLVSALSAGRYFGAPRLLEGTDHFSAVKPDSLSHPAHRLLVGFVVKELKAILVQSSAGKATEEVNEYYPDGANQKLPKADLQQIAEPPPPEKHKLPLIKLSLISVVILTCICLASYSFLKLFRKPTNFYLSTVIPLVVVNPAGHIGEVIAEHLRNDRQLDLIAVDNIGNVSVYLAKNDEASFEPPLTYKAGTAPYAAVLADLNKDSILDLIVTDFVQSDHGTMSVFMGKGDGSFGTAKVYETGSMPTVPVVGDFNGDGYDDIAVGSWNDDTISVFLAKKDGTFENANIYHVMSMSEQPVLAWGILIKTVSLIWLYLDYAQNPA